MAFHQRLLSAGRRDSSNVPNRPSRQQPDNRAPTSAIASTPVPDDPQTWVLFSPTSNASTASHPSDASLLTPGRSRASEQGSFHPRIPRAPGVYGDTGDHDDHDDHDHDLDHDLDYEDNEDDASLAEDDAELDSLDGHLPEFRAVSHTHRCATSYSALVANGSLRQNRQMMPSHDGLGSFRANQPAASADVQEQLYAHERLNKRLRRRRESHEKAERALRGEETEALSRAAEKMQRIEAWRLEQSRILLEEIQKLTRRRRQSQASMHMRQMHRKTPTRAEVQEEKVPSLSESVPDEEGIDWHDEDAAVMHHPITAADAQVEGFWTRMTKKVIRDLMGIDDRLLSILFGETLPEDEDLLLASATRPPPPIAVVAGAQERDSSWHFDVLERVARELGTLVNHLSHHPGAFSSHPRPQHAPPPHAGLPAIPEFSTPSQIPHSPSPSPGLDSWSPYLPAFQPTRPQPSLRRHASMQDLTQSRSTAAGTWAAAATGFTQDEWEQELDIKLVFRYLRSRFSSSRLSASFSQPHHPTPSTAGVSFLGASSTQDTAAKSARIRQHHPLIGRVNHRRVYKPVPTPGVATAAASSGGMDAEGAATPMMMTAAAMTGSTGTTAARVRKASSCASLNTRRSARTMKSSTSSRHYWDFGGSVGTGSAIASAGPMGSWGEV